MLGGNSLAGVVLRCEAVIMGVLGVPPLAGQAIGGHVHSAPVTLPPALGARGGLHHITLSGDVCGEREREREGEREFKRETWTS